MKTLTACFLLLFISAIGNIYAQVNARMLQYPDVSATHITFTYGGDVWIVSKDGGTANKLTSAKGTEVACKIFS